ncbi:MAG: S8 family serine peptidase, partial [Bacteroidia bacterium]
MVKSNVWIVVLFSTILSINTEAQNKKFWVKFADKTGTPYSISTPTAYLSAKAIQRRSNQGISIDQTDLPCTPAYLSQLNSITDVKVMHASKWLNSALVVITNNNAAAITTATNAINSQSFVVSISPTNKFKISTGKLNESNENMFQEKSNANPTYYGGGFWQARQLNADCIHGHGYRGQNMVISVMDAGFKNVNTLPAFDSLRTRNGILGTYDFVTGGTSVYEDDGHGTSVLSCIAAVVPGVLVGTAPMADFWLLRTEDVASETPSEEYNWIRAAEFADSAGTDIITTSLGYTTMDNSAFSHTQTALNGKTYHMSIAATMASRKGIFVLNSAGNDGGNPWQFIGVPADADSICTVGAIDSLGNVTGFSSKGPTADGRFNPDLVSRGGNAYVANSVGSYSPGNGTSFSCPVMAG